MERGPCKLRKNRIRARLNLEPNMGGNAGVLSRVAFYAGGAAHIGRLVSAVPAVETDLVALFDAIRDPRLCVLTETQ